MYSTVCFSQKPMDESPLVGIMAITNCPGMMRAIFTVSIRHKEGIMKLVVG